MTEKRTRTEERAQGRQGKCQKKGRRERLAFAKIETMAGEVKHDFDASAPERWNLKEAKKGRQKNGGSVEEGQGKHEDKAQERGGWSMEEKGVDNRREVRVVLDEDACANGRRGGGGRRERAEEE